MSRALLASLVLAAALAVLAPAASAQPAAVQAQDAWARATPPHASTGVVYLTLTSPAGDRLTGASSPAAGRASVHEMRMDGAVMRMAAVPGGLALPPGQAVALAPGGTHIMLEGLKAPLRLGESVLVHLTFQTAPPLDVQARIRPAGAKAAGDAMPGMGQ